MQRLHDIISAYRDGDPDRTRRHRQDNACFEGRSLRAVGEFADGGMAGRTGVAVRSAPRAAAVAGALGLRLGSDINSAEAVARAIGRNKLLLVLDNCEHLIDAAATLAETFVRLCPRATILATSRELLRIDGEYVYRVPPLEVPANEQTEADQILATARRSSSSPEPANLASDFSSRARTLPTIAAICRHLDGIPLAIEFAAARAATLGPQQVAAGLRDRFALLKSARRAALPRHRTLRATLDWSYELCPGLNAGCCGVWPSSREVSRSRP